METMNDFFKDEELEYGKILILNSSHKLKLIEIKKSINATKLKEIKRKKKTILFLFLTGITCSIVFFISSK